MKHKIIIWAAAISFLGAASAFAVWKFSDPHRLTAPQGTATTTFDICALNQDQYVGFAGFGAGGSDPIRFTGAKLVGVPDGLTVKGIYAVSWADSPLVGGASADAWQRDKAKVKLHPVTDVVLHPDQRRENWWLVAIVRQTKPGHVQDGGITVDYTAGGRSGSTTYGYISALNCTLPNLQAHSFRLVLEAFTSPMQHAQDLIETIAVTNGRNVNFLT